MCVLSVTCVLCLWFYTCFTLIGSWEGGKNFRVGIFLNRNLLGWGYREQTIFYALSESALCGDVG